MDTFSSNAEEIINKKLSCLYEITSISSEVELIEIFELHRCIQFIKQSGFEQVCLQFPDDLLQFSVQVALWIERFTNQKVFILGDTSYGSCCVDELAAQHVDGDAIIHMGHACLSPTSRLPVLYVLPKAYLDIQRFVSSFINSFTESPQPVLLLYDVAYSHLIDEIRENLSALKDKVVISQLCVPGSCQKPCSTTCSVSDDCSHHKTTLLGRSFCCHSPSTVVYITYRNSQNLVNFALSMRDSQFHTYADGELKTVDFSKTLRRRLYLIEKVKDAKTIGILVGTLSVDSFLEAIERIKKLAAYRGKRCYIFSVGKPNPAKLANFPEIEVYVLVSCPEACLENEKDYMQPVVTLLEAELALNSNRQWNDSLSVDFRDLIHDSTIPEGQEPLAADVSLILNRIRSDVVVGDSKTSTELTVRDHYQISVTNSYNADRSWKGLQQALGETPVTQATMGRSGIALGYEEEKKHKTS